MQGTDTLNASESHDDVRALGPVIREARRVGHQHVAFCLMLVALRNHSTCIFNNFLSISIASRYSARSFGVSERPKMPPKDKYANPKLREEVKEELKESDKGGAPGQWSARKVSTLNLAIRTC